MDIINEIIHGHMPSLEDTMRVKDCLMNGGDIYAPTGLINQLQQGKVDSDVATALLTTLGMSAQRWRHGGQDREVDAATMGDLATSSRSGAELEDEFMHLVELSAAMDMDIPTGNNGSRSKSWPEL